MTRRFAGCDTAHLDHAARLAADVLQLCQGRVAEACADYRWLCARLLEEERYFRRHDRYRISSAAQAAAEVYNDAAFMGPYMNGLLVSQPLWANHTAAAQVYLEAFLGAHPAPYRHLEVGPGHGLLLAGAARDPHCLDAVAWDVSATSLAMTADALRRLGLARAVRLEQRDVSAPAPEDAFDSIVLSEVLEHLDAPQVALAHARATLSPGGRLFVNIPINSPAPDHVFLVRTPEAVLELVRGAGLAIEQFRVCPASGYDEARARRLQAAMSVVVIARRDHAATAP